MKSSPLLTFSMISNVVETSQFKKNFATLPLHLQDAFILAFEIFLEDPYDPALALHPLRENLAGKMAFSIDGENRCIIRMTKDDTEVILFDIGDHSIYSR